ncbi:hypothetical protein KAFR_0G02130 [Kazachstania africana CBS 2517]|uniref:Uncharacterized protein n=1 Tax=Kazachstania africana (strain ATCC 22294 / BCRC 22015 / CBS 2517 / CECT 1963 / NBRC 1671 / NRRL Y-8276) TaxID=1071382 RepID=H2AXZ7_KAZAF|nr:hypothetical protein KAFR_0G02130 [Kazachstania africana CBS 2517]CCF59247.1 hypothetical protein KAFR_0G02130 [Kazachstania africana CBS 2517]
MKHRVRNYSSNSTAHTMKTKLVRKYPTVKESSHIEIKSTIYIKSKTPYISAIKRISKKLQDPKPANIKYITIMGMGKAVEKTLSIACYFQTKKQRKVEIITTSVDVIDEIATEDNEESPVSTEDLETTLKKRTISGLRVKIYV